MSLIVIKKGNALNKRGKKEIKLADPKILTMIKMVEFKNP